MIAPVMGETLSGTLGGGAIGSTNTNNAAGANPPNMNYGFVYVKTIENSGGSFSVVRWTTILVDSFDTGAPPSATTSFNVTSGSQVVATGTIGYQRIFNNAVPPVELVGGYTWAVFDNWNITGLTGDKYLTLNFNHNNLYNISGHAFTNPSVYPSAGTGAFEMNTGGNFLGGPWVWNKNNYVASNYTVTRPSGLGISGSVNKMGYNSRAFVTNSTGGTITSDTSANPNTFSFNILDNTPIYIKMLTPAGVWYNSSALFSPPSTPTPTVSPTPEPGSWSNISFTTQYANTTKIANVFVKLKLYYEGGPMGPDDWQQAVDGYTDSNGYILFQEVDLDGWDFKADFTKPGLYEYGIGFDPTPYSWDLPIYLYPIPPGSIIPGKPATLNVTVQVKSASTYAPISGAWVTIGDQISGTSYVGQATNATGYVIFPGVPNTANINGEITKSGYTPLTYWVTSGSLMDGDQSLTKYLYLTSVTVTPTITPVVQEGVSLTANPNSVNPGQSTTLTTICANVTACTGAGGMSIVTYSEKYPDPSWDTHLIRAYKWNATRTYYDWKNNPGDAWTATGTYTGLTATGTPTISGTNTYYVNLMRTDYFSIGAANVGVLVSGAVSGNLLMNLQAQDLTTGGHLSNYQMNLTNKNTLILFEYGNIPYDKNVLLPRGQDYTVQCSKAGYLYGTSDFTVSVNPDIENGDFGAIAVCPMYPTGSISAGNTTVTVKVFDAENYMPLPNVQVQMSAPVIYSDSPKYTGGDGAGVFFVLGQNQPYSVTASKTGYCAVTETGNTSTLDTKNVYLNLKYGSCLGPTPRKSVV